MSHSPSELEQHPNEPEGTEPLAATQELPTGSHPGLERPFHEPEPTTLSIPIAGGTTSTVMVDDHEQDQRSAAALSLTPRRARLGLLTLAIGAFAVGANETSVVAMSTTIAAGLDVPVSSIGLLATAFALTVVVATLPLTIVTKRWSKRLALSATFGVWTAGVVVVALSDSIAMFVGGRVLSATAHALFWAVVAPAAASLFAPHLRARTVTTIMLGSAAAGVLGTPVVTLLGTTVAWQAPYWGLAAVGFGLAIALALVLPSSRSTGAIRHSVGDLPSGPAFARVLLVAFASVTAMSLSWTYVVPLFTQVGDLPTSSLPLLFALGGAVAVGATLGVTNLLARRPVHTVAVALVGLAIAWGLLTTGQMWSAVAFQVVQAGSWAILVTSLLNWAMRHTPWRMEMGAAAYTVVFNVGAAAGPVLGGVVVATWGTRWLPFVSLGLTLVAGGVLATVDGRTVRRLMVPRKVRAALTARADLVARRREWWWRTQLNTQQPRAFKDLATRQPRSARSKASAKSGSKPRNRKNDSMRKNPSPAGGAAARRAVKGAARKDTAAKDSANNSSASRRPQGESSGPSDDGAQ